MRSHTHAHMHPCVLAPMQAAAAEAAAAKAAKAGTAGDKKNNAKAEAEAKKVCAHSMGDVHRKLDCF